MDTRKIQIVVIAVLLAVAVACAPRKPKVAATPQPDPNAKVEAPAPPPPRPGPPASTTTLSKPAVQPVDDLQPVAPRLSEEDRIAAKSLEDLNRDSLLKPAFFPLDSSDLDDAGRAVVDANASVLKKYPSWAITLEGHADERGTAEYNIALGERRAAAVKNYLQSLGIAADRLRTVSYGKEFPFEPGHDESAYAKNRRAHFVITAK